MSIISKDADARLAICSDCVFFTGVRCTRCGCFMKVKTKLEHASCPEGKW